MLQLLRHLHPERDVVGEDKMLDPSNRKWRRQAEEALQHRLVKASQSSKIGKIHMHIYSQIHTCKTIFIYKTSCSY